MPFMEGISYYNRYTGRVEQEQVLGEKYLQWIYGTASGRLALHALVKRGMFSALMGWWKNRPSSAKAFPPLWRSTASTWRSPSKGWESLNISTIFSTVA